MLNEKILDEVLPVPELAELKDQTVEQLKEEGFAVTNFSAGGVFYHLMLIALQVRIELVQLLRMVLGNMFVYSASDVWLELKAADFSKRRKAAVKTQGKVTVSRTSPDKQGSAAIGEAVKRSQKGISLRQPRILMVRNCVFRNRNDHPAKRYGQRGGAG